jgi:hypothetical protein
MGNPVLWSVRIWVEPRKNMLDFGTVTDAVGIGTAIVNVYMSSHLLAKEIAHHRSTIVIGTKFSTVEFNYSIWVFDCPASFRHRPMTCFVFLLGMAYGGRTSSSAEINGGSIQKLYLREVCNNSHSTDIYVGE